MRETFLLQQLLQISSDKLFNTVDENQFGIKLTKGETYF